MEAAVRWSPHSTGDRQRFLIVDVPDPSLTLNEVDSFPQRKKGKLNYHPVARYSKLPRFAAFDWSKTDESIIALGLENGSASLLRLRANDDGGSEIVATFKIKQQRKCNSIAFSAHDWLALAVDRTRSDVCLFVYDANRPAETSSEPVRRLCAEVVSSVRFFPTRPSEVVVGTQKAYVRLYDLREGPSGSQMAQASTRNVNNIAIDPLDENYFASAGSTEDPSVTVWDKRWMPSSLSSASTGLNSNTGVVFDFRPAVNNSVKTTVWSLRYSGQQRGRLALCSSTGELKVIDMVEGSHFVPQSTEHSNHYGGSGSWSSNRYVSESRILEHPYYDERHGRDSDTRIIAYDWARYNGVVSAQPIIALRPNREVEILHVPRMKPLANITPRQDFGLAFADMSITEPKSYTEHNPTTKAPYEQVNGSSAEDFGPLDYAGEEDTIDGDGDGVLLCDRDSPAFGRILAPGTVQRERCRRGYLFDCKKNMDIVAGNWQLERLWEIVNRFREQSADDGMVYGALDLSFVGISGLWSEEVGTSPQRRLSSTPARAVKAIQGLNTTKEIPAFEGERTDFPEHRQLCLAVCGWKFTTETLETECQELIDRGLYYQAIVQAVLHDYKHIALNLLRTLIRSKTIQNIGLGALLASDEINNEQREMCMWMAADTSDPALKALLTFLTTGDWRDVMKTNYLHLGYRLALGLKYLNDTELSGFIQSETARAVKNGDLEGILLTGLGEQSMDLFQTYITRTNDLQTAVLATAFTVPRYMNDDIRWEMWKETYFLQMQAWRCFVPRAKFNVQHARMATTREGRSLIDPPPAQVQLTCLHCQNSLVRTDSRFVSGVNTQQEPATPANATPVAGPAAHAGTVCLRCGRHMPRCGICQMWLGTPNPNSSAAARKELSASKLDDIIAKLLTFCVSCGHGFHADHARMWFAKWDVCPVPDCRCSCGIK